MTLGFPFITLLLGFALGVLTKFTGGWRLAMLFFLISSFTPWLLHLLHTLGFSERWSSSPSVDAAAFLVTSVGIAIALLAVSLTASWRVPLLAPLFPLLLGFFYYSVPLTHLSYDLNLLSQNLERSSREFPIPHVALDNIPNVWLFWLSFAASAFLFGFALTKHVEPHNLKHHWSLK